MSRVSPMPVADAICSPGTIMHLASGNSEPAAMSARELLTSCKRVNFGTAPPVAEIVPILAGGGNVPIGPIMTHLNATLGPQRRPYEDIWIEGVHSSDTFGWMDSATDAAVRVFGGGMEAHPSASVMLPILLLKSGALRQFPYATVVEYNTNGEITFIGTVQPKDGPALNLSEYLATTTLALCLPAMWAIGLMNCKNVKTEDVQRVPSQTRKQRRPRGRGLLDYSTIVLPNQRDGGGTGSGNGTPARLHTVRGHFATYTEEGGGMGRHHVVGTFWRPWSLRGNPDRGVVESDYRLKPT